jgi:molybdopterin biosynthesis enzyme
MTDTKSYPYVTHLDIKFPSLDLIDVEALAKSVHPVKPGEAVRIFTGAPMPAGADTVFMQEDCRFDGGRVIVPPGLPRGANRRLAGEDIG